MNESKEENDSKEENKEQAVIEGMRMLSGKKSKALLETDKEDESDNKGTKEREFKVSDVEMRKVGEELATRMEGAASLLLDSKEDSYNTPASQKEDPIDIFLGG